MPRKSYGTAASQINQPIPQSRMAHPDQEPNRAGGYVFRMTPDLAFRQFLVLGTRNGTFYTSETALTNEAVQRAYIYIINEPIKAIRAVDECIKIAVNRDTLILALTMVLASDHGINDQEVKRHARRVMSRVWNTPYDMYNFLNFHKGMNAGWGKAKTRVVADYFEAQVDSYLVLMGLKYRQREGFSLLDAARLGHPRMGHATSKRNIIFRWACGLEWTDSQRAMAEELYLANDPELQQIFAWVQVNNAENSPERVAELISQFRLPRESIPTQFLNHKVVWESLLFQMPAQATLRNLGKMQSLNVDFLPRLDAVLSMDTRLHPLDILKAFSVYFQGHGDKGNLSWNPRVEVQSFLIREYYRRLHSIEPRPERLLIAIDVSGSMEYNRPYGNLSHAQWAMLIGMSLKAQYPNSDIIGYSENAIEPNMSAWNAELSVRELLDARQWGMLWNRQNGGGTNESTVLPFVSREGHEPYDGVVYLSDGDTWMGKVHTFQTIKDYRARFNPNLIAVCFSIVAQGQTRNEPGDPLSFELISAGDGQTAAQLGTILDFVASVRE